MRKIYLVRHCKPIFKDDKKYCISSSDPILSEEGNAQCIKLHNYFMNKDISSVFCSPLIRNMQTAQAISKDYSLDNDFREIGVGEWEGLSFDDIKKNYPEEYKLRGIDPYLYVMPGGELPENCLLRAKDALLRTIKHSVGNIVIVSHSSVNRLLLAYYNKQDMKEYMDIPQPYGCINILNLDQDNKIVVDTIGYIPEEL